MSSRRWGWFLAGSLVMLFITAPPNLFAQYTMTTVASSEAGVNIDGQGVAVDATGNVYTTGAVYSSGVIGSGPYYPVVLKINTQINPPGVAVTAGASFGFPGCYGATATTVGFTNLGGVALDSPGNIYIAQIGNGPIVEVSDSVVSCLLSGANFWAQGIVADNAGNIYFSSTGDYRVYKANSSGGLAGCGGGAISDPDGLALDSLGNLYIADPVCHVIWKMRTSSPSSLAIAAGTWTPGFSGGFSGDGGPATSAQLNAPKGVAVDADTKRRTFYEAL